MCVSEPGKLDFWEKKKSFKNYAARNILISRFAIHNHCRQVVDFFSKMEKSGVKPKGGNISLYFVCLCTWGIGGGRFRSIQ